MTEAVETLVTMPPVEEAEHGDQDDHDDEDTGAQGDDEQLSVGQTLITLVSHVITNAITITVISQLLRQEFIVTLLIRCDRDIVQARGIH